MQQVVNLAMMDCERENTEMITLFLQKFNEALGNYKQDPNYTFEALANYKQDPNYTSNPYGIMCDENVANQLAIENVYGKDFLARVVTCQWHFKQCVLRQLADVHIMVRETFRVCQEDMLLLHCYRLQKN